jgi:hypothetical protein
MKILAVDDGIVAGQHTSILLRRYPGLPHVLHLFGQHLPRDDHGECSATRHTDQDTGLWATAHASYAASTLPHVFILINKASLRTTDLPMERNKAFRPEYEPFRYTDTIRPDQGKIYGPVSFLNSTQAHFIAQHMEQPEAQASTCEHCYKWTARNNRKGRHALLSSRYDKTSRGMPPPTNGIKQVVKGIWRMFTFFPVWSVNASLLYASSTH